MCEEQSRKGSDLTEASTCLETLCKTLKRPNSGKPTRSLVDMKQESSSLREGAPKSFRTDRLERELQMVQLSATRCSCIAILRVSLVIFAAITLCVASQRVFVVVSSLTTQSGNFLIYPSTTVMAKREV
jgi:hypothetical protein